MDGPEILARTMTATRIPINSVISGNIIPEATVTPRWHAGAAFFDLLGNSALLQRHVAEGKVIFGVNHTMRDFKTRRKKDLDLVIARPGTEEADHVAHDRTLKSLAFHYGVVLTEAQADRLEHLPNARSGPVGNVLVALEAKACMTKFSSSRPRLDDELNSSHLTIHGASAQRSQLR